MSVPSIIATAIRSLGINEEIDRLESLSGGCIHDVRRITTSGGLAIVCKCSYDPEGERRLQSEQAGLAFLASLQIPGLVLPRVLGLHVEQMGSVLMTEWLQKGPVRDGGWSYLGRLLAGMHAIDVGKRYGFHEANHIGGSIQVNEWRNSWIEFNRDCRFSPQIEMARRSGLLESQDDELLEQIVQRLPEWIPDTPFPSALHGDLWSGNVMPLAGGRLAIIDPACSIGDGWADMAMLDLFGGVPRECFDTYAASTDSNFDDMRSRMAVYQIYHILNHLNLFGAGYLHQLRAASSRLLA